MIRLLAVDVDGTLLDSRGRLPPAHRAALAEADEAGVAIALVTGRSFHFARPVAEALELGVTLIVNNGAAVKATSGITLQRSVLSRSTALAVLASTVGFEDSVAIVFDREPGDEERQIVFERMDWTHPHRSRYYAVNRAFIAESAPLTAALTEDPIQVMFNGGVERMRSLAGMLRRLPVAKDVSVAVTEYEARDFSLVDVNAAGCSKGTTLARWAATLGVGAEEVMAVGDNLNDVEMLEYAGTPVVMGNAAPTLMDRGYHVTGSHDDDGLADAIRRFALPSERP
jgi:Cof subfamily protein (haloacid dehalogenase superfamily)